MTYVVTESSNRGIGAHPKIPCCARRTITQGHRLIRALCGVALAFFQPMTHYLFILVGAILVNNALQADDLPMTGRR